jgi:hypothetical protein
MTYSARMASQLHRAAQWLSSLLCRCPARLLHYYLPQRDVLFLHSGCNVGPAGDVSLFFGLSGGAGGCDTAWKPAWFDLSRLNLLRPLCCGTVMHAVAPPLRSSCPAPLHMHELQKAVSQAYLGGTAKPCNTSTSDACAHRDGSCA